MFHAVGVDLGIGGLGPIARQLVIYRISKSPQAVHGIDLNHNCVDPPILPTSREIQGAYTICLKSVCPLIFFDLSRKGRPESRRAMRISRVSIVFLLLVLIPIEAGSRDGPAIWDSRCEECHGESAIFAGKYLWDIEGELQGRHHIDNLNLFMGNHYTPDHEIEIIHNMLLAQANSSVRFNAECSGCHGGVKEFVEKSIWVGGSEVTGLESGMDVTEFLPTHQQLQPADVTFYQMLFARIAGKPIP